MSGNFRDCVSYKTDYTLAVNKGDKLVNDLVFQTVKDITANFLLLQFRCTLQLTVSFEAIYVCDCLTTAVGGASSSSTRQ